MSKSLTIINNKDTNEDIIVVRIDGIIYVRCASGVKLLNELNPDHEHIVQIKMAALQLDTDHIDLLGLVEYDYRFFAYIENQTEELCLFAVKQDGWALEYVIKQTEEICLAAVKQNGWSLYFVKNQTEEICLAAVKQDGWALQYVKEQTEEICLSAVKQNGSLLEYVKNQTEEICLAAVKQYGYALEYVDVKTYVLYIESFSKNIIYLQNLGIGNIDVNVLYISKMKQYGLEVKCGNSKNDIRTQCILGIVT